MLQEPLSPADAKKLIRRILREGRTILSQHALEELKADDLTAVDCTNVLKGGVVEPGEWERGSWRYRVRTAKICVVAAFRSEDELVVVTAWRRSR